MVRLRLVGLAEVAGLAGVTPQAVANWRARFDDFPEPIARLHMGPIWDHRDAVAWLRAKGKLRATRRSRGPG